MYRLGSLLFLFERTQQLMPSTTRGRALAALYLGRSAVRSLPHRWGSWIMVTFLGKISWDVSSSSSKSCTSNLQSKATVLLCFIDPRVWKIRNKASNCLGIFSRTLRFYYVANSPGAGEKRKKIRRRPIDKIEMNWDVTVISHNLSHWNHNHCTRYKIYKILHHTWQSTHTSLCEVEDP